MRMRNFLAGFIKLRGVFSFYISYLLFIGGLRLPWKTRMRINKLL